MDAVKLVAPLLCACTITSIEEPSSSTEGAPTSSITIDVLAASGDGTRANATADLNVDGLHAKLGKGDAFRLVDGLGDVTAFVEDNGLYDATLATSDTALAIQFVRDGAVALTKAIPLPPPFSPIATSSSRASGIALSWQAAPAFPMVIVATGSPCLPADGFRAHLEPDTGAFEIQPADLITAPGPCTISVAFTRGLQQTQTRTVTVPTTP